LLCLRAGVICPNGWPVMLQSEAHERLNGPKTDTGGDADCVA